MKYSNHGENMASKLTLISFTSLILMASGNWSVLGSEISHSNNNKETHHFETTFGQCSPTCCDDNCDEDPN